MYMPPSESSSSSGSSAAVVPKKRKQERASVTKNETKPNFSDADESDDGLAKSPEADEPVLSHAEKRRKKRDAKRAEVLNDIDDHSRKKRKLKDGSSKAVDPPADSIPPKRQNSVWVGNLSYKTQQSDLRSFFSGAGEITRINMPTKMSTGSGKKPDNRGFAYIDFATSEAKIAAIALSEQPLFGRKLLIKDGDSFEGRPAAIAGENVITDQAVAQKTHSKTAQKILSIQKQPAAPTLFFGNLPFETTEDDIRQLLGAHRPRNKRGVEEDEHEELRDDWIRKVRMGTFEDSGLCKGFAFVDFTSVDNATAALINPKNHRLNGRNLVVEYASPDAVRRGASKTGQSKGGADQKRCLTSGDGKKTAPELEKVPTNAETNETFTTHHEHEQQPRLDTDSKKVKRFASRQDVTAMKHQRFETRSRPGAALAQAKREAVAIVPSQGKKIVF